MIGDKEEGWYTMIDDCHRISIDRLTLLQISSVKGPFLWPLLGKNEFHQYFQDFNSSKSSNGSSFDCTVSISDVSSTTRERERERERERVTKITNHKWIKSTRSFKIDPTSIFLFFKLIISTVLFLPELNSIPTDKNLKIRNKKLKMLVLVICGSLILWGISPF